MKTTITKKEIIKALQTEPLIHQMWVKKDNLPEVGDCGVCAVGAVLRHCRIPNDVLDSYTNSIEGTGSAEEAQRALERGDYLSALSMTFEQKSYVEAGTKADAASRRRAIEFVEKNFPAKIALDKSKLQKARENAFDSLVNAAYVAEHYEGFVHPYPDKVSCCAYNPAERRKLTKAYTAFLKKQEKMAKAAAEAA